MIEIDNENHCDDDLWPKNQDAHSHIVTHTEYY